jgi:hypothetical protein
MNERNFIDHSARFDPENSKQEIEEASLEAQYSKLTEREKLILAARILGYRILPPRIDEFYSDSYYLGDMFNGGANIFDFWKQELPKIFPNQITTKTPWCIFRGSIGTGKSLVSKLFLMMIYTRLLCLKNPSVSLGLAPKVLSALVVHKNELTAEKEFLNFYKSVKENTPFFRNTKNPNLKFQVYCSGPLSNRSIGTDLIVGIYSEINFIDNTERAKDQLATGYGRIRSRFSDKILNHWGGLIADSSPRNEDSCTQWLEEQISNKSSLYICEPNIWTVRPNMFPELADKTLTDEERYFRVYSGSGKVPPQIIPDGEDPDPEMDPDRIIKAPRSLLDEARMDLRKMLQDRAGIPLAGDSSFFSGDISHLVKDCCLPNYGVPEVMVVDFYDQTDRIWPKVERCFSLTNRKTTLWVGCDAAYRSDKFGLAVVALDGFKTVNKVQMPLIKVLLCTCIGRKNGQSTSILHVFDFIMELNKYYNVIVSADRSGYSTQLIQDCTREFIKTRIISTDIPPCSPALYLKTIINHELIKIPKNNRLIREAYDLKNVVMANGNIKVDHPAKKSDLKGIGFPEESPDNLGSKDQWDALASSVYSLRQSLIDSDDYGTNTGFQKTL